MVVARGFRNSQPPRQYRTRGHDPWLGARRATGDRVFRKARFPAANRIERTDPEGTKAPEGAAEIRGEPGFVGSEPGNGRDVLRSPTLGQIGTASSPGPNQPEEGSARCLKRQLGNSRATTAMKSFPMPSRKPSEAHRLLRELKHLQSEMLSLVNENLAVTADIHQEHRTGSSRRGPEGCNPWGEGGTIGESHFWRKKEGVAHMDEASTGNATPSPG